MPKETNLSSVRSSLCRVPQLSVLVIMTMMSTLRYAEFEMRENEHNKTYRITIMFLNFRTDRSEQNSVAPDQTAPRGAV